MNIAIDARSLENNKTGVSRYLSGLLRYWKNNREHKFILYFKDGIPDDSFLRSDNFELRLLKNPFGFPSNFFFQHFLLSYYLKKDKVNFFFSPFYLRPFYCPVKSSVVLHDISYEAHPEWFDFKSQIILRTLSKFSAKTANLIFTVSNYSKNEIIKYYKIDPDKIIVTHLAPDDSFIKIDDAEKIKNLKEKYNLNKFILSVGSIFNRRHIPEIIEAFEKMAGNYNDYQFLIIGKNHTHPFIDIDSKIKTINNNLGRNAIIHLDFVKEEELLIFYNSCEINIYLSDYEGFGLPVIEAQFFGKPVITSYNSSLIEVGGDSVEFVKENTAEEIYDSLNKIISDEEYKNRLIKLGDENIKRFDWEKCAGETLNRVLSI
jgi:glycosyltransferase involved in cell wall biosynthesis